MRVGVGVAIRRRRGGSGAAGSVKLKRVTAGGEVKAEGVGGGAGGGNSAAVDLDAFKVGISKRNLGGRFQADFTGLALEGNGDGSRSGDGIGGEGKRFGQSGGETGGRGLVAFPANNFAEMGDIAERSNGGTGEGTGETKERVFKGESGAVNGGEGGKRTTGGAGVFGFKNGEELGGVGVGRRVE